MHQIWNRVLLWVVFYAISFAVCVGALGLVSLWIPIANWAQVGLAVWLLVCFAGLCFPDDIWDRWLPGGKHG